jgi:hypothetical protein
MMLIEARAASISFAYNVGKSRRRSHPVDISPHLLGFGVKKVSSVARSGLCQKALCLSTAYDRAFHGAS